MKSNDPKIENQWWEELTGEGEWNKLTLDQWKNLPAEGWFRKLHDELTQNFDIEEFSFDVYTYAAIFYCARELFDRLQSAKRGSLSIEALTRASAELREIIALRHSLAVREKTDVEADQMDSPESAGTL
jgi:hypothetical protein